MAKLYENLLATADLLASAKSPLGSAALRRGVSTAYYALFSRLATLCAGRLARTNPTSESYKLAYRAIDHSYARSALLASAEFGSSLGDSFKRLQEARHWADYSADSHPESAKAAALTRFTRLDAQRLVSLARDAVQSVDALPSDAKQRLALLLVARSRR